MPTEELMDHKNYDSLKIEHQLCFPLYACSREVIKRYTPYLTELGLTYTQYVAMLVVWEHKQLTSKELGLILYLDSGTLTPLLRKLEAKGLITRQRSASDERNLLVTVTEEGLALRDRALHIPVELAKCVSLNVEESVTLHRLLYKLLEESK